MAPKAKAKAAGKAKAEPQAKVEPKAKAKGKAKAAGKAKAEPQAKVEPEAQAGPATPPVPLPEPPAATQALPSSLSGSAIVPEEPLPAPEEPSQQAPVQRDREEAPEEAPPSPAGSGLAAVRMLARGVPTPEPALEAVPEAAPKAAPDPAPERELPQIVPAMPPPALESAEERACRLEDVADPWADVDDASALRQIESDEWARVVTFSDGEDVGDVAAHIVASDRGLAVFHDAGCALESGAVSLDVSENALERIESLPPLWIRNLLLKDNPLSSLEGLCHLFPRLLAIDLSFVDLSCLDGAWSALSECPRLQCIVAEGSCVDSFEAMEPMPHLRSLELIENNIEEVTEIATLAELCPALVKLDLRENPIATESGYIKAVKKHLPNLEWHNNQSMKKSTANGRSNLKMEVNKDVAAVDGLYKNESCSCLDGNPCLDEVTCKDWTNRNAVAAEARRRKGLRDDFGKRL